MDVPRLVDTSRLGGEDVPMPKSRPPYPEEFRERILELHRSGRSIESLAREFEPTATTISNWVKQSQLDAGERECAVEE